MANKQLIKAEKKVRRQARTRAKFCGTAKRPRLSVFRSLNHISAQMIDDFEGKTLVAVNDNEIKVKGAPIEKAKAVGRLVAEKAIKAGISEAVFDRGAYKYHGRVKAVAEGAREAGIKF